MGRVRRASLVVFIAALLVAVDLPLVATPVESASAKPEAPDLSIPVSEPSAPLVEAELAGYPEGFVPPSASQPGEYQTDPNADPTPVRELVESRTTSSETWENADGTYSTTMFTEPKYFQPVGSNNWVPIDNSVVVDESAPGWFRNAGNAWSARFGPVVSDAGDVSGGVVIDAEGQHLEFAPSGVKDGSIVPVADAKAGTVTYAEVWPGVDVRYTVRSWGVKEDLVVKAPISQSSFEFETNGAAVTPTRSEKAPGELLVGGSETFRFAAPSVVGKEGTDVSGPARPVFETTNRADRADGKAPGQNLKLSVDPAWLKGLAKTDFPVTIDPSTVIGADNWASYGSATGWYCGTSCGHRVGNALPYGQDMAWRSIVHIPYEWMMTYGQKVVSATLNVWRNSGTSNGNVLYGCPAISWSYAGACAYGAWGSTTVGNAATMDLTNLYRYWVDGNYNGGLLGLVGNEVSGLYTFKEMGADLTIVYNTPPPQPANNSTTLPAHQSVFSTYTPTLQMNALTDANGDSLFYGFNVTTGADGISGSIVNSPVVNAAGGVVSWTLPAGTLRDGQTYYWRAWASDFKNVTLSNWVRSFKVDMRLGGGGPSPTDQVGPVQVNLATGNLTLGVSTPSLPTVGGSTGVSLTYNSRQAPSTGLRGSYFWDGNTDRVFNDSLYISRDDPQINFDWGTESPAANLGGDQYLVRWEGYINAPTAGSYKLGVISDDGVRVYFDNNPTPVIDRWFDQTPSATPYWSGNLSMTGPKRIRVEYYEGLYSAKVQLWMRPAGSSTGYIVPASSLSTDSPAVPSGWTFSTDDAAYVSAAVNEQSVVLRASDGSSWEYKKVIGANGIVSYAPPVGIDDVMVTNLDGTIAVHADDSQIYVFNTSGQLKYMTSSRDDRHPAAIERTWNPLVSGTDPLRLKEMWDPVSDRHVTLTYASSTTTCPTADGSVAPPVGMLCKVSQWDGTATDLLYDASGRLVRVVNPGGSKTTFVYDSANRITKVYDPLANDAIAAAVRTDNTSTYPLSTVIAYNAAGKVASVTAPEPEPSAARPAKTYTYGSGSTSVAVAGVTGSSSVTFDANNRLLTATDPTGKTSTKTWDGADRPTSTVDAAGIKSTTIYDSHGWATDSYGPAPASAFTGFVGNSGVARSTTTYDGGINGLAAAFYDNSAVSGSPEKHATGINAFGTVDKDWGTTPPHSLPSAWGVRLTGEITLGATGNYLFATWAKSGVRVFIDDKLLIDAWNDPGSTSTRSPDGNFNNTVANSLHRIRIDVAESTGTAAVSLQWVPPGGGAGVVVPAGVLKPRYGLPTTTTGPTGAVATTSYTSTNGIGPEFGLPASVTQDPSGLALTTTNTYETPGSTTYLRPTSKTLPAGASTAVSNAYYGDTETRTNPCDSTSANQAGRLKMTTDADPDGTGSQSPIRHETIYDSSGRSVATRTGTNGGSWICTTYDTRGRVTAVSYPAYGGAPARTVTNDYAVGGNPLVTSVTDPAGTITTAVDLLGRTKSSTDVWGKTASATYNQAGQVTTRVTPGPTYNYTYDAAGRLETLANGANVLADPHYDSAGRMDSVAYPASGPGGGNGTVGTFTYDANGRPATVTWRQPDNTVITSDAITARDIAGRVTDQSIDGVDPYTSGPNYVYDNAGRLTTARVAGHTYSYVFAATGGCGTLGAAGKNTNRTSMVDNSTTTSYCYDNADRLTSSTDTAVGTISYDDHGNSTAIFGETHGYDVTDRHLSTIKGSTNVSYTRNALDGIVERRVNGSVVARYSSAGASFTLDASSNIVETVTSLPGGVLHTDRGASKVWSYPNLHGDLVATTDNAGVKQGATTCYDPYGNTISGTIPDNSAGSFDNGWLGQHQKGTEQEAGLEPVIEMGARQYSARLGRFIEQDPIKGGSANDYEYTAGDPVNRRDLAGMYVFTLTPGVDDIPAFLRMVDALTKPKPKLFIAPGRSVWAPSYGKIRLPATSQVRAGGLGSTQFARPGLVPDSCSLPFVGFFKDCGDDGKPSLGGFWADLMDDMSVCEAAGFAAGTGAGAGAGAAGFSLGTSIVIGVLISGIGFAVDETVCD
jgi:RHS repeat-associated protein